MTSSVGASLLGGVIAGAITGATAAGFPQQLASPFRTTS